MISITYDETCDMAYIRLNEDHGHKYHHTECLDGILNFLGIDVSDDGRLLALEITNASRRLPLSLIKKLQDINKARKEPRDFLAPGC